MPPNPALEAVAAGHGGAAGGADGLELEARLLVTPGGIEILSADHSTTRLPAREVRPSGGGAAPPRGVLGSAPGHGTAAASRVDRKMPGARSTSRPAAAASAPLRTGLSPGLSGIAWITFAASDERGEVYLGKDSNIRKLARSTATASVRRRGRAPPRGYPQPVMMRSIVRRDGRRPAGSRRRPGPTRTPTTSGGRVTAERPTRVMGLPSCQLATSIDGSGLPRRDRVRVPERVSAARRRAGIGR
jgi:hypothetical protein